MNALETLTSVPIVPPVATLGDHTPALATLGLREMEKHATVPKI